MFLQVKKHEHSFLNKYVHFLIQFQWNNNNNIKKIYAFIYKKYMKFSENHIHG